MKSLIAKVLAVVHTPYLMSDVRKDGGRVVGRSKRKSGCRREVTIPRCGEYGLSVVEGTWRDLIDKSMGKELGSESMLGERSGKKKGVNLRNLERGSKRIPRFNVKKNKKFRTGAHLSLAYTRGGSQKIGGYLKDAFHEALMRRP